MERATGNRKQPVESRGRALLYGGIRAAPEGRELLTEGVGLDVPTDVVHLVTSMPPIFFKVLVVNGLRGGDPVKS